MWPLSLHTYAALIAFFISALTYRKWKGTAFRWWPFFLSFIAFAGYPAGFCSTVAPHGWVYPVVSGIALLFFGYIYLQSLNMPGHKKLIRWFMLAVPGLVLMDLLLVRLKQHGVFCPMAVGSVFMILASCLFFYELLLNPVEEKLRINPMFWFGAGVLFFYLGALGQSIFYHFVFRHAGELGVKLFLNINNNLILILYSCFIVSFLCKRNLRRSLSQ